MLRMYQQTNGQRSFSLRLNTKEQAFGELDRPNIESGPATYQLCDLVQRNYCCFLQNGDNNC